MYKRITIIIAALMLCLCAHAQKPGETNARFSIGTDLVTWANFGTGNLSMSVAAGRQFSIHLEGQYNPWEFHGKNGQFQNKKQNYNLTVRWWPWHVYSGWWTGLGAQYQEYNHGGIMRQRTEEGDAVGLTFSGGYTLMLTTYLNLDFSFGLWGGYKWYTAYSCPKCGRIIDQGRKIFFNANDISIALVFVF